MKKVILSLLFMLTCNFAFANEVDILSLSLVGLGRAGIADVSVWYNPANLANRSESDPSIITYFTIDEQVNLDEINTTLGFFQYPSMIMGVQFFGSNLSLTLNLETSLEDREYYDDALHYIGYNTFLLQLDWGYKLNVVDFGMRLKGGSIAKRGNFEIRNNLFFLSDYIVNTFFSEYTTLDSSDFFSLSFALRFDIFENLSFALLSESDLDLTESTTNNVISYLKETSLGFTYVSNTYSDTNELNNLLYKISIDLVKIGDPDYREFRIGNELKLELSNNKSLALRVGYYELKPVFTDIFKIDSDLGNSTYALVYSTNNLSLSLDFIVPINTYTDLSNGFSIGFNSIFSF